MAIKLHYYNSNHLVDWYDATTEDGTVVAQMIEHFTEGCFELLYDQNGTTESIILWTEQQALDQLNKLFG
jgi:hypothetical protein